MYCGNVSLFCTLATKGWKLPVRVTNVLGVRKSVYQHRQPLQSRSAVGVHGLESRKIFSTIDGRRAVVLFV